MSHEENEGWSDNFQVSRQKLDKIEDCFVILFTNWYLVDKSKKQEDVCTRRRAIGAWESAARCALDNLKQQRPAVFIPINYFIFTFIFFTGWSFCISSFGKSTSRVQNHKSKKKRTNRKLPPFLFLHVLVNIGFCDIAIWSLKL